VLEVAMMLAKKAAACFGSKQIFLSFLTAFRRCTHLFTSRFTIIIIFITKKS
jgi:hypothetical protein